MKDAIILIRIMYWLRLAKIDIDFLSENVNPIIRRKANKIKEAASVYDEELLSRGTHLGEIIQDFSADKIYAIQSVLFKMMQLDEAQCQQVENMIEIKNSLPI